MQLRARAGLWTGEIATSEQVRNAVARGAAPALIVIAGTSGIIAASDRKAPECAACQEVLRDAGTVVLSPLVLAEVDHLARARFGPAARTAIIDFILDQARRTRFEPAEAGLGMVETARLVQRRYATLDLDLADALNVALAAAYRTDVLLTLDRRDFRAVRPLTPHEWFRLLPARSADGRTPPG